MLDVADSAFCAYFYELNATELNGLQRLLVIDRFEEDTQSGDFGFPYACLAG